MNGDQSIKPYQEHRIEIMTNTDQWIEEEVGSGACFIKELTITIKFYPAYYSLI
jgi:hypothetical protein